MFDILKALGKGLSMEQALENTLGIDYDTFEINVYDVLDGNGREV